MVTAREDGSFSAIHPHFFSSLKVFAYKKEEELPSGGMREVFVSHKVKSDQSIPNALLY